MLVVSSTGFSQQFVLSAAPRARWNIWFQFGCVWEQKKKILTVHIRGLSENWEHWEEEEELCFSSENC